MQTTQGSMLRSLRSARSFLDDHADVLGDVVKTGTRQRLDDAIRDLALYKATQSGSDFDSRSLTQRQDKLRKALLQNHVKHIVRVAAADLPAAEMKPFRMPRGRPTVERLAAIADGMGEAAGKFTDTFVAAGLPLDFVARMKAATEAMLGAIDARTNTRRQRSGATKGLKTRLSNGRKIVDVLDAFVVTALDGNDVLLAEWNAIKKVQATAGRPAASPPEAPSNPTVTPPTPGTTPAAPTDHVT